MWEGGGGGDIDYWPFSPLWICACFVGKTLITIVGCLETLCWVYKLAFIPSNNNHHHRKMTRSLITKKNHWGKGKGIFYLSVKHLVLVLKRTVSMRRFPSSYVLVIKRKFYFFITHTFTHVGYLDACEKTVYILSDNHIMTKPKKRLCQTMKQIIFGLLLQKILLITFKTYTTPSEVQILM